MLNELILSVSLHKFRSLKGAEILITIKYAPMHTYHLPSMHNAYVKMYLSAWLSIAIGQTKYFGK